MSKAVILPIPTRVRDAIDNLHRSCVIEFGIERLGRKVASVYNELFLHKLEHALERVLLYGYPTINFTDSNEIMIEAYDRSEHELDDEELNDYIANVVCIDDPIGAFLEKRGHDWLFTNQLMAEFMVEALPSYSDFGHVLKEFHDEYQDVRLLDNADDIVNISPALSTVTVKVI